MNHIVSVITFFFFFTTHLKVDGVRTMKDKCPNPSVLGVLGLESGNRHRLSRAHDI